LHACSGFLACCTVSLASANPLRQQTGLFTCRIAIEQQAALVPVLALGESLQLRNAVNMPSLQQYTYRKLGFPVPFVLHGRWGLSPFPRKVPLVYVIGKPIPPPVHEAGQHVDAAAVDALHARYYGALEDLYARYRHLHPAFEGAELVLTEH
jgi:2-acylglycerol O-acyltransferase 2